MSNFVRWDGRHAAGSRALENPVGGT